MIEAVIRLKITEEIARALAKFAAAQEAAGAKTKSRIKARRSRKPKS
jgi:hypothetical protein